MDLLRDSGKCAEKGTAGDTADPVAALGVLWIELIEPPDLATLRTGVALEVISDGQKHNWWFAPWEAFAHPLWPWKFCPPGNPQRIVVYIEAEIQGRSRQSLWPASLIRLLRLLDLHPGMSFDTSKETDVPDRQIRSTEPDDRVEGEDEEGPSYLLTPMNTGNLLDSSSGDQALSMLRDLAWVPLHVLSWQSRGDVAARYPELGFLLAPSVEFCAPYAWNASSCPPSRASEREVRRFFFRDLDTNLAHHHALGNRLAPTILSSQIGDNALINATAPSLENLEIAAVEGTAFQRRSSGRSEFGAQDVAKELWNVVQKRHKRWLKYKMKVLIFDDDASGAWKPFWDQLFGPEYWIDGFSSQVIDGLKASDENAILDARLQCADASLVIIDLRLTAEDQQPGIPIENLSGIRLLKLLQEPFAAPFCHSITTPLLVFTSSQRFASEHQAIINGADGFVHKPSRFEDTGAAMELLTSIARFLHPAFGVVRNRIWWHESRQVTEWSGRQAVYLKETLQGLRRFRDLLSTGLALADDPLNSSPGGNKARGKSWSRTVDVCLALEIAREAWMDGSSLPSSRMAYSEQSDRRSPIAGAFRGRRLGPTGAAKSKVSDPWKTLMDAIQHFRHLYAHRGTGILPNDRPPGWLAFANLLLASNIALKIKMEPVPVIPKALELRKHRDPLNTDWWDISPPDHAIAGYWACRQLFVGLEAAEIDLGKNDPVRGCIIEFARECAQEILKTDAAQFPSARQTWLDILRLTLEQIRKWPGDS